VAYKIATSINIEDPETLSIINTFGEQENRQPTNAARELIRLGSLNRLQDTQKSENVA